MDRFLLGAILLAVLALAQFASAADFRLMDLKNIHPDYTLFSFNQNSKPMTQITDRINFSYSNEVPAYNPKDTFYVHANQASQQTTDGHFNPSDWNGILTDGASATGLSCAQPINDQLGVFPNGAQSSGHSMVQICTGPNDNNAIGIFMNSSDYITPTAGPNRLMYAPMFELSKPIHVFTQFNNVMDISMDIAAPIMQSLNINLESNAYIQFDLHFTDTVNTNGGALSISVGILKSAKCRGDGSGFDPVANSAIANACLGVRSDLIQTQEDSAPTQSTVFLQAKHFHYTLDYAGFKQALSSAATIALQNGMTLSQNPSDYAFDQFHTNGEMHWTPQNNKILPSMLGYSQQNLQISAYTLNSKRRAARH